MTPQEKSRVDDSDREYVQGILQGARRDVGYNEPGYVKYIREFEREGYLGKARIYVEIPVRRSVDKEASTVSTVSTVSDVDRETAVFERMLPELLLTKLNLYVAVYGGSIIDEDADEIALARRMEVLHHEHFVLIRQVRSAPSGRVFLESPEWEAR